VGAGHRPHGVLVGLEPCDRLAEAGEVHAVLVVQRREGKGTGVLRGIRHQRIGDGAFTRDLASHDDWRAALESLGVSLARVAGDELRSLHARMLVAHEEWVAASER
jgi:N-hydroxyarylamine O-acetyltransferase